MQMPMILQLLIFRKNPTNLCDTVKEWSAFEQCDDIKKTAMLAANRINQGKGFEVARII